MWDFEPDLTGPLSGDDSLGSIGTPTQLPSSRFMGVPSLRKL
jgi:hypothetical protein